MTATDTRTQFFDVWNVYWPIALAVLVLVAGLVLLFLFRDRARDGGRRPGGRDEHTALEGAYALALACVAAFLVALTFSRMPDEESAASGPPLTIEVTASRWNWRFEYPNGAVEQGSKSHVPVLRVPVDTPLELRGSSLDVIHSFWVPEARFKRDLFPRMRTSWRMSFDRVANWLGGGECAEFCGLEHARMVFDVLVMPPARFERWLRSASTSKEDLGEDAQ